MNKNSHEIIIPLNIEAFFRSHRLDELKEYLNVTEKYLKKAEAEFEARSDIQIKQLSDEDRQEYDDSFNYAHEQYSETFPRILRSSFLVSVISLFEQEVEQLISKIKKERKIPISMADLHGNFIKRVDLYCKLANISISSEDDSHSGINNYYMIRNCIVHNNGFISGFTDEKKLLTYAKKMNIVDRLIFPPSIRFRDCIALSEQFCKEVIETMQKFLVELEKEIAIK